MKKIYFIFMLWFVVLFGNATGTVLIQENFQDWTNQAAAGTYSFSKSLYDGSTSGTFTSNSIVVVNNYAASGTGSLGRVTINTNSGYLQFPELPSIGTITLTSKAGTAGSSFKMQYYNGSSWVDITTPTTLTTLTTSVSTYTYNFTYTTPTTLRIYNNQSGAVSFHDIQISSYLPILTKPTVGTASIITGGGFTANWTAVANASSYDVKIYNGSTLVKTTNVTGASTSSAVISGLSSATSYTYTVTAVGDQTTNYSNSFASSSSSTVTTATVTPLTTPTNGSASSITAVGFTANWSTVSSSTGYYINVYTSPGGVLVGSTHTVTGQSSSSVAITGLSASTAYTYTVTAIGDGVSYGNSAISSSTSVSTIAFTKLSTPTVRSASGVSTSGITANWTAVSNASNYTVTIYDATPAVVTTRNISGASTAALAITGLTLSTNSSYTYTVTAIGDGTLYSNSNESSKCIPYYIQSADNNVVFQYATADVATLKTDLGSALGAMGSADIYELTSTGGAYTFTASSTSCINLSKTTILRAKTGLTSKPVIKILSNASSSSTSDIFTTTASGLTFTFDGIEFNGANTGGSNTTDQPMLLYAQTTPTSLYMTNCYVHDFLNTAGSGAIRYDGAASSNLSGLIDIQGSTFNNCGGRILYYNPGTNGNTTASTNLKNNTFCNNSIINSRANVLYSAVTSSGSITIDHCTFYNLTTNSTDNIIKVSSATWSSTITNCVFSTIAQTLANATISNCYLAGFTGTVPTGTNTFATAPTFTNESGLDFSLSNKSSLICNDGYVAGNTFGVSLAPFTAPTIGSATNPTAVGFTANWTKVTNATAYIVNVYLSGVLSSSTRVLDANTLIISILTANTSYTYKVIALGDATTYSSSVESTAASVSTVSLSALSTPTISAASSFTAAGFTANWATVSNASSYDVKLYQFSTLISTTNVTGQTSSSIVLSGLTAGLFYTYTVTAKGDAILYSNSAESTASSLYTSATLVARSPIDIRSTGFTAYWTPTSSASYYDVTLYQGTDLIRTDRVTLSGTGATASSSIIYTGLSTGLTYTYSVTTSDGYSSSSPTSATLISPTILETFSNWTDVSPSAAVSQIRTLFDGLTSGTFTCSSASVSSGSSNTTTAASATGNARPSTGRISIGGASNPLILPTLSNASSITIKALSGTSGAGIKIQTSSNGSSYSDMLNSSTYFYKDVITATTISINSLSTTYLEITPLQSNGVYLYDIQVNPYLSPSKLTTPAVGAASSVTTTGFTANWTAVANALGYYVRVFNGATVVSTTYTAGQASTSLAISGLIVNTTYNYKVIAIGNVTSYASSDASDLSNSFTTLPPAPAISSFTPTSAGNGASVVITGTNLTGASAVSFGGTAATSHTVNSDTQITATVSTGANGSVSVTTPSGTGTKIGFIWLAPVTTITDTQAATDLTLNSSSIVTIASGGTLTIDQNTSANSITVQPGGKLTLADGKTLSSTVTLQNTASASASFVDSNASDTPPVVSATVNQDIAATDRNWYVSVSVSGKTTTALTFGAGIVRRDEPNVGWITLNSGDNLVPGVGYISTASTAGSTTWNISGNLNSGLVQVPVTCSGATYTGFNLLGNPYPSYLNWSAVLNQNSTNASILQPTIWYRTKSGASYSFQTYNATGDLGTPKSTSGYIPPMQAFWVRANAGGGTVTMNNSMRSHGDGSANMLKVRAVNSAIQPVLRLEVQNLANSNTDEAVVYFNPNAQNTFDKFDSPKMSNNSASIPEIYTQAGSEKVVINGLNAMTPNQEIPLGFTTGQSNAFSIKASEISNFDASTQIILKDNLQNSEYNLTNGTAYNFTSDVTSSNVSRFSVVFKSTSITTGIPNNTDNSNLILVYRNVNNQITINCASEMIGLGSVTVYNAVGQKLENETLTNTITVIGRTFNTGVYLVTVVANGKTSTQKVVIN